MMGAFSVACQKPEIWHEYRSPEGTFVVEFPGKSEETSRTSPLSNGDVKYPQIRWNGNGVSLDITYAEIPDLRVLNKDEAKEYYEFLRTQMVKMNHSQLMQSEDIIVNGKSGQDFTEVRQGGKVARYRLFLLGTKLLSLRAEQDVGVRPITETSSTVEKFMTSLRFPE